MNDMRKLMEAVKPLFEDTEPDRRSDYSPFLMAWFPQDAEAVDIKRANAIAYLISRNVIPDHPNGGTIYDTILDADNPVVDGYDLESWYQDYPDTFLSARFGLVGWKMGVELEDEQEAILYDVFNYIIAKAKQYQEKSAGATRTLN